MAKWFGKGCEFQYNQWEDDYDTGGPDFMEELPVMTGCNHINNPACHKDSCRVEICPINFTPEIKD